MRTGPLPDNWKNAIYCISIIFLLPLLFNLPGLLGWWSTDPIHFVSGLATFHGKQILPGYPWIDPNVGFTGEALGKLSADEWLSGRIPWWNHYSGIGLPLAAEMQSGALFLPLVLLNHFSNGPLYIKVMLQILAGLGTYLLLDKIGLMRLSAIAGAILYQFNGVFAWHGAPAIGPIAFLPWLILGIERAREKSLAGSASGCSLIAVSIAFSIYSGFPETAYIDGLLASGWSLWRIIAASSKIRYRFIIMLLSGVIVGLLLSMPAIIPFIEFCRYSYLGAHGTDSGFGALPVEASPQLFFPWLYGSIFSHLDSSNVAYSVWANTGGYFSLAQLTIILCGLFSTRRSSLFIVLVFWILICLGRTFGMPIVSPLVDLVPLLKGTAFFRYSAPSWELCSAVLCAIVIDDISSRRLNIDRTIVRGLLAVSLITGISLYPACKLIREVYVQNGYSVFLWASLGWGFGSVVMLVVLSKLFRAHSIIAGRAVTAVLAIDAIALFAVSSFSGVTSRCVATAGVNYLKRHIGLDRFYKVGPIPPNFGDYGPMAANYGAYYRIASINHIYLPVAQNWVDYIKSHIDPYADPICFNGNFPRADAHAPPQDEVLRHNVANYVEIGVAYVVTPHGENPFQGTLIDQREQEDARPLRVFESEVMDIYKLSGTKPYFETVKGSCDLHAENRSVLSVNCRSDSKVIRRELYYPGWTADVGGQNVKVEPYNDIFQAINVPSGKYKITFSFTPTHWPLILTLFFLGASWVIYDLIRGRSICRWRTVSDPSAGHHSQRLI